MIGDSPKALFRTYIHTESSAPRSPEAPLNSGAALSCPLVSAGPLTFTGPANRPAVEPRTLGISIPPSAASPAASPVVAVPRSSPAPSPPAPIPASSRLLSASCSKMSIRSSCMLPMFPLLRQRFLEHHERLDFARAQLLRPRAANPPPRQEVLEQRLAFCRDVRLRARPQSQSAARPHQAPRLPAAQPPAVPLHVQAGFPASVALPTGLVGPSKVEGDEEFFRSSSVRPASRRTAASASRNTSSGPRSTSASGVASAPSSCNPEMPAT